MKKIRISILILVLLGSVCIVAGTVIGCAVKKDNNIIKESVYTRANMAAASALVILFSGLKAPSSYPTT